MRSASEVLRDVKPGLPACVTVDALEVHSRAEGVADAGDQYRAHLRVGAEIPHRVDDAVSHRDRERVLGVGPVEHDPPDPIGIAFDAQVRFGHEFTRLVRMLTTDTPEPRPPALCWSA